MVHEESSFDRLLKSGKEAISPSNLFIKAIIFLSVLILTAVPYVIRNFDSVWSNAQSSGATNANQLVVAYLFALWSAVKTGYLVGLSTLADTMLNFTNYLGDLRIGTLLISAMILLAGTVSVYSIISFIMNVLDREKGEAYNKMYAVAISLAITLIVLAPASYIIMDGETVTSSVPLPELEEDQIEILENATQGSEESDVVVINMLGDDE